MKRQRHTPDQIISKLRTAEQELNKGKGFVGLCCRALEVSALSNHRCSSWRERLKVNEAKRLKKLEKENIRLKRLLADA